MTCERRPRNTKDIGIIAVGTATIRDVAKLAKASIKTVSRVINQSTSVSEQMRERVMQAIAQLNYHPDPTARSLSNSKTYALGLVYDNPNAYYVIAMQQGALSVCLETGYALQIYPCDASTAHVVDRVLDFVHRTRLAGLILLPPMSEDTVLLGKLTASGIPFVRVISAATDPGGDLPCVSIDDRDAAYATTEHLIRLGHTRIGFLWGRKQFGSSTERYDGYQQALRDYGIKQSKHLVINGDYTFDDGFRGAHRLLSLTRRPTAIFASNDEIAAGALAAARAAGLNVPFDLSIAGFEDSPFSRHSWPPLTTSRQRTDIVAERATRLLIATLRGKPVKNESFAPELVVRGSTAPPQRQR